MSLSFKYNNNVYQGFTPLDLDRLGSYPKSEGPYQDVQDEFLAIVPNEDQIDSWIIESDPVDEDRSLDKSLAELKRYYDEECPWLKDTLTIRVWNINQAFKGAEGDGGEQEEPPLSVQP